MSPSTLSRAAAATVLLASTASAAYTPGGNNVAIYWGQGAYQRDLSVICDDPSVDIVNIGFVNGFPKEVGDYPALNFGKTATFSNDSFLTAIRKRLWR
jgi:chitinase